MSERKVPSNIVLFYVLLFVFTKCFRINVISESFNWKYIAKIFVRLFFLLLLLWNSRYSSRLKLKEKVIKVWSTEGLSIYKLPFGLGSVNLGLELIARSATCCQKKTNDSTTVKYFHSHRTMTTMRRSF